MDIRINETAKLLYMVLLDRSRLSAGKTKAIFNPVKNSITGIGWTNVDGTEDQTVIDINTEGQSLDY